VLGLTHIWQRLQTSTWCKALYISSMPSTINKVLAVLLLQGHIGAVAVAIQNPFTRNPFKSHARGHRPQYGPCPPFGRQKGQLIRGRPDYFILIDPSIIKVLLYTLILTYIASTIIILFRLYFIILYLRKFVVYSF
jgi:hypothetical protein